MTTRIKLRRDTAQNWTDSNPILANGEPGLESDTNQFKFGDGVTVWNSLGYANANGGAKQSRWVGVLNTCGNGQYTTQSSDGLSWTAPTTIEYNQYEYIWGLAIGPNSIVYIGDNPGGNYVKWAKNPSEQPHEIEPVEINYGPTGEYVNFNYVHYIGGYFIAFGSYQTTQVITNPNITMPYWIYSEDGQNWHRGGVNLIELETIIDTKIGNDSDTIGMRITDVTYNGTGWLFSCDWDYYGNSPGDAGGFYLTDITGTLNSASRGTDIPTAESAHWDGIKWWTYLWDNEDDTYYTNSSTNPTLGTWTQHAISTIAGAKFGIRDGYQYSVEYISQGSVDGVDYLFMGIDDGRMLVTADKGTTWSGVIPNIRRDTLSSIDGGPYTFVVFNDFAPNYVGDKLTISGSSVSAMNGTFYVGILEGEGYWPLYSDINLNNPVSITDWTIDNVEAEVAGVYGSYKLDVLTIDGTMADLRVGMICSYNNGKIVAINGTVLTMDVPNWNGLLGDPVYFKACVEHSFGDHIQYHQVGGEEVLVQVSWYDGQKWAVAHADPRVQDNWTWRWASNSSQSVPYLWINDFAYGSLNSVVTSWTYQNPEFKDAINEMVLTDRFTLSLTGSGQYDPPASTTLFMDPNIYSWSLSARSGYYGSDDLGSISSWENNDVRMSINNYAFILDYSGKLVFNNDGDTNSHIIFGNDEQVAVGYDAGTSGQGADSVALGKSAGRYNQGGETGFAVAIGSRAGDSEQGHHAIAIGRYAGGTTQGVEAIAIGHNAGNYNQGAESIAIGHYAANSSQAANSIVLNATGGGVASAGTSTFVVKPIASGTTSNALYYDTTTGQITYGAAGGGGTGDLTITNSTITAPAGSLSSATNTVVSAGWDSGSNKYLITLATGNGYTYHTKVLISGTDIAGLDGNIYYLSPTVGDTVFALYSDYDTTHLINGSSLGSSNQGSIQELIPGTDITLHTANEVSGGDAGEIEFHIGNAGYSWRIGRDNNLHLPANGGSSKILNYGGHPALFANDAISVTSITNGTNALTIQTSAGAAAGVNSISYSTGSWQSNPSSDLATTGGTGTGLTVDVAESGGYAQTITVHTAGSGYTDGDSITVVSGSSSATFYISVPVNVWSFGTNGKLTFPTGGPLHEVTTVSVSGVTNLTNSQEIIFGDVNTATDDIFIVLPANPPTGKVITVKNIDAGSSGKHMYIQTSSGSTPMEIQDGTVGLTFAIMSVTGSTLTWVYDGTTWRVTNKFGF